MGGVCETLYTGAYWLPLVGRERLDFFFFFPLEVRSGHQVLSWIWRVVSTC